MGKRKKGRCARNAKKSTANQEPEELTKAPHSFVIYRGRLGKYTSELLRDFRKVMEPFTASSLKVQKRNVVKDFIAVAGMLHVTHLVIFTKTDVGINLRISRVPRGPTLTFRVLNYTLAQDVLSSLKRRITYASQFMQHALLVLNNLSGEGMHLKLIASMFQNMFPSINVNKVNLNSIRRCVLLNYNTEDETLDFRHYTVKVTPCGGSKPVRKLIRSKIPNLSNYQDISDFITAGNVSESEVEVEAENKVILAQPISSRGNIPLQESALRLTELGPRMTLQLVKIEEGLLEGETIFHRYVQKTQQEIKLLKKKKDKQRILKKKRKLDQEKNVKRKELEKQNRKQNSQQVQEKHKIQEDDNDNDADDESDTEWYLKEVGEKPDKDLFLGKRKSTSSDNDMHTPRKKAFKRTGPIHKRQEQTSSENNSKTFNRTKSVYLKKKSTHSKIDKSKKKTFKRTNSTDVRQNYSFSENHKSKHKKAFWKTGSGYGKQKSTFSKSGKTNQKVFKKRGSIHPRKKFSASKIQKG